VSRTRALIFFALAGATGSRSFAKKPKAPDPRAAVQAALDARGDQVGACALAGATKKIKVTVKLVLGSKGQLLDTTVTTDAANDDSIRACIQKVLAGGTWPKLPPKYPLLTLERDWKFELALQ
jgi:hypothetical protein